MANDEVIFRVMRSPFLKDSKNDQNRAVQNPAGAVLEFQLKSVLTLNVWHRNQYRGIGHDADLTFGFGNSFSATRRRRRFLAETQETGGLGAL